MGCDVTVVISTRNRKLELQNAISSALEQRGVSSEVLVIDDGSTDGTYGMVRELFPGVRIERCDTSLGYIVQRNRGADLAESPFVFSLDDDATFSSPFALSMALDDFSDPRIGAVAVPWINVVDGLNAEVQGAAPDKATVYCTNAYTGLAHAVRRDLFLNVGGYRGFLKHGSEELDFCSRLLDAGYVTRLGTGDVVYHHESPVRNVKRQCFFAARNGVLYAWYNVPGGMLPIHLPATIWNHLRRGVRSGHFVSRVRGVVAGFAGCLGQFRQRRPIALNTYRTIRILTRGPQPLPDVCLRVPSPQFDV